MVIKIHPRTREHGMLMTDLVVAMAIIVIAIIPLSFSFVGEKQLCQAYYCRAIASEIVDGEMEKLAAGEWRHYQRGKQAYAVKAEAAKNLRGRFTVEISEKTVRLDWEPDGKQKGGHIFREIKIK